MTSSDGSADSSANIALTQPATSDWRPPPGFRASEVSTVLHTSDWSRATNDLLHWRVKTRSGFIVPGEPKARRGERYAVEYPVLGLRIREPIEIVAVVESDDLVGFAYRTREGHPVSGEEAFILRRDAEGIRFTVRSLTRPGQGFLRHLAFPLILVVQRVIHARYLRALSE